MSEPRVVWVDFGLEQFARGMRALDETRVRVGVVGPEADKPASSGRISVAEAALISEYGSRKAGIPARRAVSGTITADQAEHHGKKVVEALMSFGDTDRALDEAGGHLAELISARILRGDFDGNAASTVKKKGFDHPLIDTAGLVGAVGHQLVRGDGDLVEGGASEGGYQAFEISGGE